ncbi:hypothetical protein ACJX0J_024146, partial [Zea mays]
TLHNIREGARGGEEEGGVCEFDNVNLMYFSIIILTNKILFGYTPVSLKLLLEEKMNNVFLLKYNIKFFQKSLCLVYMPPTCDAGMELGRIELKFTSRAKDSYLPSRDAILLTAALTC